MTPDFAQSRTRVALGFACLASLVASCLVAPAARASVVLDDIGDFLSTHAGVNAAELDIGLAAASRTGLGFSLFSIHDGDIGTTPGASFVWGVNRGAGAPGLFNGAPAVGGPNVLFDAVVVIRADGSGSVTAFNEAAPPTTTLLAPGAVASDGTVLGVNVPLALLPSRGFNLGDYSFNLWTRSGGGNAGIADLAVFDGNFVSTSVPEPGSWAMLIAGFGAIGGAMRRRSALRSVAA